MNEGILGAIANPQLADVAGALNYRQSVMDKDEQKRKEITRNKLIAQAIPNMAEDSPIRKLFETDPQAGALMAKTLNIPLNDGEAFEKFRGQVRQLASVADTDPRMAIDHAKQIQAENQRNGIQDTNLDRWLSGIDTAMQNNDENGIKTQFNALHVMDQNINSDYHEKQALAAQAKDINERKMKVDERQVAAQEARANSMTPFEQAQVKHWNDTSASAEGGLSDDAIELAATRLLNGEAASKVLANMGRGAQGAADIRAVQNRLAEKAKGSGIDASKILQNTQNVTADNRTFLELGAREGKIATAVQEAQNFAKIALDASNQVPRDKFVPWNKLKNYSESQLSDPNLASFKAANTSLINAYARAVGGGSVTVHGQEEGEKMLNTATSPEAYSAVVKQILTETQAALDSPKQVREHMHTQSEKTPSSSDGGWSIRPAGGK